MPFSTIATDAAPRAIGPYCQAILRETAAERTLYCAGQIALDPATQQLVEGDARTHTGRVMDNIRAVLEAAGMGFADVVKSTIFLVDLADFAAMNEVYGACFGDRPPPRSTVQVAALPRGSRVEIEVLAVQERRAAPRPRKVRRARRKAARR